jgi:formylglycine-generating enzyme required for sulfatase activity
MIDCLAKFLIVAFALQTSFSEAQFEGKEAGEIRLFGSIPFCWCPKGEFVMGSPMVEVGRNDNEKEVEVAFRSGFWLGQYEITQREWVNVMKSEPWKEAIPAELIDAIPELPAVNVRYPDACEFCKKLTQQLAGDLPKGWQIHLPTEAQWEYACRSGSSSAFCYGNELDRLNRFCHFGNKMFSPIRGGSKLPNSWNLRDMHGNVREWCFDTYKNELTPGSDPVNSKIPDNLEYVQKVVRGGDFSSAAASCRSACRSWAEADFVGTSWPTITIGFRIAVSSQELQLLALSGPIRNN